MGGDGGYGRAGSGFEVPSPVIETVRVLSVEVGGGLSRGA